MSTTKQYDGLNRLTNITTLNAQQSTLNSFSYGYNNANQRTNLTLADGFFWVYKYDGLGEVTSGRKYWPNGTPVAGLQFTYGFDDIGNRKTAASGGDQLGGNLHVQNYTVNNLNQYTSRTVPGLVDVTGAANSNATVTVWGDNGTAAQSLRQGEHFYAALPVNNPTGAVWLTLTNVAVLPDSGNPDIVTNTTGKALVAKTPEGFTYDYDGNLTSDALWSNRWNAENRRSNVESRTTVASAARAREQWTYLPDGRWIERIVSAWNGSTWVSQYTNRYVWDGQVLMAMLDHTNGVVLSFLRGLDLSGSIQGVGGVGGLLAVSQISNSEITNSHFACFDGNGNVMALVAAGGGSISAEYEYGPFGEEVRATGLVAAANPIRFSTQYPDDLAGDLKYLFREYNPTPGRWNSRDPIEELGGVNVFGFVGNDSINATDLLGLEWKIERDPTRNRAIARPEPGDTIRQLAEKIHLSPEDYRKWLTVSYDYSLKMPSLDEPVSTCNSYYEVPNRVYVNDLLSWRFVWWTQWRRVEETVLRHEGFKVVRVYGTLRAQLLSQLSDADVHGIVVVAHGDEGSPGNFSDAGPDYVTPLEAETSLHHKLAGFKAIWCFSGNNEYGWRKLVSPTGYLYTHPGYIFIWQSWPGFIQHGFPDN